MFRFIGYNKEEKEQDDPKLDLTELRRYIAKKCGNNKHFIKNFKTPLDLGKYQLALMVESIICQKTKAVDEINYVDLRKCLYIMYKINEFLEHPELYASNLEPIESVFTTRSKDNKKLIKEWEEKAGEGITEAIVERYSEIEMIRLFRAMKRNFWHTTPPEDLPDNLKTGSGFYCRYSELHSIIHHIYCCLPKMDDTLTASVAPKI